MQLKNVAVILVSGFVLAGCSLLPGQAQKDSGSSESTEAMQESQADESLIQDDSMMKADEVMEGGEKTDDDSMMKDEGAMMQESEKIEMVAENFSFSVKEIKVKQGEKLVVSLTNNEGTHDFRVDVLGVNSGIVSKGDTVEVEIPTDKPGSYEFYCSVGQHREMGMRGSLIIE